MEVKEDKITLLNNKLDVFKIDYENQNIENNIDFKKWKEKMKKANTDKIGFYRCNDCKICFYNRIYDEFNHYSSNCPICKKEICCFCSQYIKGDNTFPRYLKNYCCLKRFISFIFFREKFSDNSFQKIAFIMAYIAFIIPYINSTGIILSIIQNLFCLRKTKYPQYFHYHDYYYNTKRKYYNLIKLINVCFSFCLSMCYLSLTLFFMIAAFLLSIPFKMLTLTNLIFYVSQNSSYNYCSC